MQCSSSEDGSDDFLTFLVAYLIIDNPPPVQLYVNRAANALDAWQIGLQTGLSASGRSTISSFQYNPKNWITVAGSTCAAKGVPGDMQGSNCPLSGGVIGVCATRYYTATGEIVDTTAVMLDTFQQSASSVEAQSVFTHEVGHCLGLKHTASTLNIMYPDTSGANTPNAAELAAVADGYSPVGPPSVANGDNFYQGGAGGPYLRQFSFPSYYASGTIGSRFTVEGSSAQSEDPPPGPPVDGVVTVWHLLYADGREEMRSFDTQGRRRFSAYFASLPPR